jgi:lysylphosphatidylglycerol synthetase-like protein (DUF2156 family)
MPSAAARRERALDLLRRFGTSPESICLAYEAPWRYHFGRSVEGVVAYLEAHGTAVVWGDPICAPESQAVLLAEFTVEMREAGRKVCLLIVEEDVARAALDQGYAVIKIGEEPVFDLGAWRMPRGDSGKKLRWCLNKARREGVEVGAYRAAEGRRPALEAEIAEVQVAWEAGLGRPPANSFLRTYPLQQVEEKLLVYGRREGRLEAVLACAPVPASGGWYLEDMVRRPDAAVGATELLVVTALDRLGHMGAASAALGVAPFRGREQQLDRRARLVLLVLHPLLSALDRRYHFRTLSQYKAKFRPTSWRSRYVAVLPALPGPRLARAIREILG